MTRARADASSATRPVETQLAPSGGPVGTTTDFKPSFPAAVDMLQHRMRLFRCATLLDELAFSYYFHQSLLSQALHTISLPILLVSLTKLGALAVRQVLLSSWATALLENIAAFVTVSQPSTSWVETVVVMMCLSFFLTPYVVLLGCFDRVVGLLWLLLLCGALFVSNAPNLPTCTAGDKWRRADEVDAMQQVLLWASVSLGALLGQFLGHLVGDRKFPAFRWFEAVVTTPFLMLLLLVNRVSTYRADDVKRIRERASLWKDKR